MKKNYMLFLAALLTATTSFAAHLGPQILFTAHLNGSQEVPAVNTDATGVASLYLNGSRDTLCVRVSWNGLSGDATGIHIHEGAMGINGGVLVNFTNDIDGNQVYGNVTGANLTPSLIAALFSGNTYLNLHTAANANGEIRGQIMAESDPGFYAFLNTDQETDPVMGSTATGFAVMKASRDKTSLWIEVIADSLTETPGGAHIHWGSEGMSGGVILNLTPLIDGNRISGTLAVTPGLVDSLMSGMAYINLHTTMNPNGEIRGQIANLPVLGFDAILDKDQETTPVLGTNDPRGVAHFHLFNGLDSFHFLIHVSDLSGEITGAHLHEGAAGTSGGVVLNLTPFIDDNVITGVITGADINEDFVNHILSGELYLNVHTTLNPNGELRGQVYRYLREGYPLELDALQETEKVQSAARGIGFVSVDRDQSNFYIETQVTGLSGAVTGAHIHTAARGMDGGVSFNLTDWFMKTGTSDMAMGTMMLTDAQQKADLRNGMMYLNVHTAMYPNGEIRGQIERKSACGMAPADPTGFEPVLEDELLVYPNPTQGVLNIQLDENTNATYTLFDMTGRIIQSGDISGNTQINLSGLPNGIFMLQVNTDAGQKTIKVQKQQ